MQIIHSIIIPHKEIPNLLIRAIRSIPDRDDIQVIVVDDCSKTHKEVKLIESEVCTRKNIRFIYLNEQKGPGPARNEGLRFATGKWIHFLDADDFFTPDAFTFFDEYIDSYADLIYFSYRSIDFETSEIVANIEKRNEYIEQYLLTGNDHWLNMLKYCDPVSWGKMFKHSFITSNGFEFGTSPTSEDVMFSLRCGYTSQTTLVDSRASYYHITSRPESICFDQSKKMYRLKFSVQLDRDSFLKKINLPEFRSSIISNIRAGFDKFGFREGLVYSIMAIRKHISPLYGINDTLEHKFTALCSRISRKSTGY